MPSLEADIAALTAMSSAALRQRWRDAWRQPAPDIGPDLMRRGIAWKLQQRVHGGLATSVRRELERAIENLEKGGEGKVTLLKPGTQLIREWGGTAHHVLVCEEGFEYDGRQFASLSQIARLITGAHWSGPRFFGLRSRRLESLKRHRGKIHA